MSAGLSWIAWCSQMGFPPGPPDLRVRDQLPERRVGDPDAARCHVDATELEPADGMGETASLDTADQPVSGDTVVLEDQLCRVDPLVPELLSFRPTPKPSPFSARNIDMPLWRGCTSMSVFTRSAKQDPSMPFVIHVLVPLITYSVPFRTARVWTAWVVPIHAIGGAGFHLARGLPPVARVAVLPAVTLPLLGLGVRIALALGLLGLLGIYFLVPVPAPLTLAERSWGSPAHRGFPGRDLRAGPRSKGRRAPGGMGLLGDRLVSLVRISPVLLLILAVLGTLYVGVATPSEAGARWRPS
jgi:hypothetical protein